MPSWERFSEAAVKVLLALVPTLFKVLWDHWPKTPPERRHEQSPGIDGDTESGRPASP